MVVNTDDKKLQNVRRKYSVDTNVFPFVRDKLKSNFHSNIRKERPPSFYLYFLFFLQQ